MRAKSRQQGGSYGNTLIGIFSCAFTKLDALQSESERHNYAVNQGGFLKHSPNDFASLIVYAISQLFDVWLYHKWWKFTEKKFGDKRRFLWLRNNGSTLISQILNTALFTAFAFWGTYDFGTLVSIFLSSYVIYIFTSLLDTPAVYLARFIHDKKEQKKISE